MVKPRPEMLEKKPVQVPAREALRKVPPTTFQCGPFHQQLVLIQDRVAGVTLFAIAWTTSRRSYAVLRQTTVGELAPDKETEGSSFSMSASRVRVVKHAIFTGSSTSGDVNP
jgi:hypothetical protein